MTAKNTSSRIRIGRAAEALGVSVETLRRWEAQGTLSVTRSAGGQRLIDATELSRRLAERRQARGDRPVVAQSARNRFTGIVTRVERDRVAAVVEVAAVSTACSQGSNGSASITQGRPITVLAASSLQAAFTAAGNAYAAAHPDSTVTFGFDASSGLRAKLEEGAAADLFASADVANAQRLIVDGLAIGPVRPFAGNGLAIVVPRDNPAHIETPADLARPGVRLVSAGDGVPITSYATQLIDDLARQVRY